MVNCMLFFSLSFRLNAGQMLVQSVCAGSIETCRNTQSKSTATAQVFLGHTNFVWCTRSFSRFKYGKFTIRHFMNTLFERESVKISKNVVTNFLKKNADSHTKLTRSFWKKNKFKLKQFEKNSKIKFQTLQRK